VNSESNSFVGIQNEDIASYKVVIRSRFKLSKRKRKLSSYNFPLEDNVSVTNIEIRIYKIQLNKRSANNSVVFKSTLSTS
jgi:hypothetical protein